MVSGKQKKKNTIIKSSHLKSSKSEKSESAQNQK